MSLDQMRDATDYFIFCFSENLDCKIVKREKIDGKNFQNIN